MVVPVVVFPGTVLVVEITLVVRVFLDKVIAVVLHNSSHYSGGGGGAGEAGSECKFQPTRW